MMAVSLPFLVWVGMVDGGLDLEFSGERRPLGERVLQRRLVFEIAPDSALRVEESDFERDLSRGDSGAEQGGNFGALSSGSLWSLMTQHGWRGTLPMLANL
jgi:hypothetical protein